MAIIGLPKSLSFTPVARHNARAPAILRPSVLVADRNFGIDCILYLKSKIVFLIHMANAALTAFPSISGTHSHS